MRVSPGTTHTEHFRQTRMDPSRLTKVVRKGTVNVQRTEWTLGGTGELAPAILGEAGGPSESSMSFGRTGNLMGTH